MNEASFRALIDDHARFPGVLLGVFQGVDAKQLRSKSKNTPFDGWKMQGAAVCTIVGGKVAYQR